MKPSETLLEKAGQKEEWIQKREKSFQWDKWIHLKGASVFSSLKIYSKGQ